jgi:hypothetical protein
MVDFGEPQVFEGHVAKTVDRIVGREFSLAHLLEQFADGFGVHESSAISS